MCLYSGRVTKQSQLGSGGHRAFLQLCQLLPDRCEKFFHWFCLISCRLVTKHLLPPRAEEPVLETFVITSEHCQWFWELQPITSMGHHAGGDCPKPSSLFQPKQRKWKVFTKGCLYSLSKDIATALFFRVSFLGCIYFCKPFKCYFNSKSEYTLIALTETKGIPESQCCFTAVQINIQKQHVFPARNLTSAYKVLLISSWYSYMHIDLLLFNQFPHCVLLIPEHCITLLIFIYSFLKCSLSLSAYILQNIYNICISALLILQKLMN